MNYDLIVIGSGFASIFFLKKALESGKVRSALVLERGGAHSWEWQIENRRNTLRENDYTQLIEHSGLPEKRWIFNIGLGGGSNCWWANIMRFHPYDFELQSRYGIGVDWPVSYLDIEPYYSEAEDIISVSGDPDSAVLFPRSRPFPQPRHRFSRVARRFKDAAPDLYFAMPQARARVATGVRNPCCSNGVCNLCPVNAKFMIVNDLRDTLEDPRITLETGREVRTLLREGGRVVGVAGVTGDGTEFEVRGETVALGANGIFNPFVLQKSDLNHGPVGRGLQEQNSLYAMVLLDGIEDGDGSAVVTGVGYHDIHGDFRREAAGGFFETHNLRRYRAHPSKWRQMVEMYWLFDDLREDRNHVGISAANPDKPVAHFEGWSDYSNRGVQRVVDRLPELLGHLPVEDVFVEHGTVSNHAHVQGTTVMGNNPDTSVVDGDLKHHAAPNLVVLGAGAFPTAGWANPTLTICALSLRAAERYYGKAPA